ncbi:MAG: hypothetical protein ACYC3Q_13305 [Gemmatimonadaceae bacterium]
MPILEARSADALRSRRSERMPVRTKSALFKLVVVVVVGMAVVACRSDTPESPVGPQADQFGAMRITAAEL